MAGDSQWLVIHRSRGLTDWIISHKVMTRGRPGRHVSGEQSIIKLSKQQVSRKEKKKEKRGSALHIYLKESATK